MPISGNQTTTTRDEFIAFAAQLRAMGAVFVKVGALEARFPAAPVHVHEEDDEPSGKFRTLTDLDDSERAELTRFQRERDQEEELG